MAIVQEDAFLRLGRLTFEVPAGLTTWEAVQQAKQEIADAAIQLMLEMKLRNYLRRCKRYQTKHRPSGITERKLVRKAIPGWKRAAYHRIRVIIPSSVEARAQRAADLTASGKLRAVDEDWKNYLRGMKKEVPSNLQALYNLKKEVQRRGRQNQRRKTKRQLAHTDQIAANTTCSR